MSAFIFYFLASIILISALMVVMNTNPIYSALSLAITMVSLAFMYFELQAPFIAGVQLIVYAGAVMVLFVMVIMMFDLQKETQAFSGGSLGRLLKVCCGMFIVGTLIGAIANSWTLVPQAETVASSPALEMASTKALAVELFTKYIFAFEALGILLLLIAVGVVAVARTKGGTHGV
ncbi:MAG: NADH-quinone oxidoreductase subunit J [Bdellovibrionota bacterium]